MKIRQGRLIVQSNRYLIETEFAGIRLDKAITVLDSTISRMAVQRLLDEGNITVNGKVMKPSYKVELGDEIEVKKVEAKETDIKPEDIPIEILYEDNDIIVVNKPKGLVVHPANGNEDGTLVNAIMNICKGTLSGIGGEIRPRNSS